MGEQATFILTNSTKFTWTRQKYSQQQMDQWDFPQVIAPGMTIRIPVEFSSNSSFCCSSHDQTADVKYIIGEKTKAGFTIHAKFTNITASFESCKNLGNYSVDLGWHKDGMIPFTIASSGANFENLIASGAPTPNWMGDNLTHIGHKQLKEICLPGSHNSGMSSSHHGTTFGSAANCKTQDLDVKEQLESGIRYFDIRPIISRGEFYTGHYSNTGIPGIGWQGALGQSIREIIQQINGFTALYPSEVIFLVISHTYNADSGYRDFSKENWDSFCKELGQINAMHIESGTEKIRLAEKQVNELAGVSVIVPDGTNIGSFSHQGYYHKREFNVIQDYANTNNLDRMKADQLQKMTEHATKDELFAALWTLTQTAQNAALQNPSVLTLASRADQHLHELTSEVSAEKPLQAALIDGASSHLTAELISYNLSFDSQRAEVLGAASEDGT